MGIIPVIPPPIGIYPRRSRRSLLRQHRQRNFGALLNSDPEQDFDNIVLLATHTFAVKAAAIVLVDDGHRRFKATCGFDPHDMPEMADLCTLALESETTVVVDDALADPRCAGAPAAGPAPTSRFFAGMRIVSGDGTPLAVLCLMDPAPRPHGLSPVEQTAFRALASQVQSLMDLRRMIVGWETRAALQSAISQELQFRADHDELTQLPQRGLFQTRMQSAIAAADRDGERVAMMLVDVDHFKQINDALGHDVGDELLRNFASRLRTAMRTTDTVARLGGDEFGVLLPGIHADEDIDGIVRSLNDRLQQPMLHNGRLVDCYASIGLAIYPDHAKTLASLAKCSDLALAAAKTRRGCTVSFRPSMGDEFDSETRMLAVARDGIAANRMVPYYQPKVDLASGALVGFEALVRCLQPDGVPMLPETFAPAFADHRLAAAISRQMVTGVLDDVRRWVNQGLAFGHVAINACPADFQADDFAERLLAQIHQRGLPVNLIELEITENVFLGRGADHVARALNILSARGMRIALDDFGTGYASLTQLKQYPVDVLKIDRSFVGGIGKNPDDITIIRALIGLGNRLGIEMVAEGIETRAQSDFVLAHGCDVGQGFLYGGAQAPEHVPTIVARFAQKAAA